MGNVTTNTATPRPVTAAPKPPVLQPAPEQEAPGTGAPATEAPAPAAAPARAVKQGRGLFGHFADVFIGGGEAVMDMVNGIGTLIAHPIQTIKGIGYAITHPAALFHAFVDPYTQAIAEGRPGKALGRGIVEIGSFFITGGSGGAATGGAKGAATAANAATKAGQTANAAGKAGRAASAASKLTYATKVGNAAAKIGKDVSALTKAANAAKAAGHASKAAKLTAQASKLAQYQAALNKAAKLAQAGGKSAGAAKLAVEAATKVRGVSGALKAAEAVNHASKVATAASKAGQTASTVAKAARIAEVPVMTKAAQSAIKSAGISEKAAQAGLKAAHVAYWEARAAGQTATAAKAAAAAKAAKAMGVAKNVAAVDKVVTSARLAGAAADASKWFTRTNYVTRPLEKGARTAARLVGRPIDAAITGGIKASTVIAEGASATASRLGGVAHKLGAITLKEIVAAPFKLPGAAIKGARSIISGAVHAPGAAINAFRTLGVKGLIGEAFKLPGTILAAAKANPASLIRPAAGIGMANRIGQGALGVAGQMQGNPAGSLSDEQAAEIAKKYGLEPTKENVAAFIAEVQSYQGNTIGPDTGTPEQVKQLQTVLRSYGYDVDPTGTFDEKTANAVIDFKTKHGISQSYKLEDGTPAVNEYVDEATAAAIVEAIKKGEKAGDVVAPATTDKPADKPATETADKPAAEPADKPAAEEPAVEEPAAELPAAQPVYTVAASDRAAGLSGIARRYLGDANRWKEIYDLNKDAIGNNPNLILPGQKLKMPAGAKGVPGNETAKPATKPADKPAAKPEAEKPVAPTSETKPAPKPADKPAEPVDNGNDISDAQVAALAKEYGLKATRANIEAFSNEVNSYRDNAIGPDAGDAATVKQLQAVLAKLGYKVQASGNFDESTTEAVIQFKVKHGIHQSYKLANGDFAINEYVDEATAQAMANALTK